ncbi:MAG: STAS domain-containing protein [Verrucomicrobia bacterium]|jgi:anti-sigma B factor antagonist|nr:STAS domain-containing protein [Verrucomicrobiota bacterium]
MHLETQDTILVVSGIQELTAVNATEAKTKIKEALNEVHTRIDVDLSSTSFIDSSGLGVLIGLHKAMVSKNGSIRIVNPTDSVQQVLELTRLHRLFEIVTS